MAKQANNKTDALFRQKLENFEVNPPEASWEVIQGQISKTSPYTGLAKYSFLAILLLFTVGVSYMAITLPTLNNSTQAINNQSINTNQSGILSSNNNNLNKTDLTQTLQNKLVNIEAENATEIIDSKNQKNLINNFVSNILSTDESIENSAQTKLESETKSTVGLIASNAINANTNKLNNNKNQITSNSQSAIAMLTNTANLAGNNASPFAPVNPFNGSSAEQVNNQFPPATPTSKRKKINPLTSVIDEAFDFNFKPLPLKPISTEIESTLEGVKVPDFYPSQVTTTPRFHFGAMHLLSHTWRTSALDDVYLQNQAEDYSKNLQLGNSLGFLMGITTPKRWMFEAQFIFFSRQATEFTYRPEIDDPTISFKVPEVTINLRYLHLPLIAKKQFNLIPNMPNLLTLGIFAGPQFTMLKSGVVTTLDGDKTDNTYRSYELGAIAGTDVEIGIVKNLRFRLGFNTMATNKPKYLFNPNQNTYSLHSGLTSAVTYRF